MSEDGIPEDARLDVDKETRTEVLDGTGAGPRTRRGSERTFPWFKVYLLVIICAGSYAALLLLIRLLPH